MFSVNRDSENRIIRFKAWTTLTTGLDYTDTYSPVVSNKVLRMMLALCIENDWDMRHFDVKTAYLNAPIGTTVYVEQPEGYQIKDRKGIGMLF